MQQKIVFIFSSFIPLYGRLRRLVCPSFCIVCPLRLPLFSIVKWSVWPDWAIYWTLGYFLEPLATINLLKSPTFLGNFYKVVKIYDFWATFIDIWQFFSGHTESEQTNKQWKTFIEAQTKVVLTQHQGTKTCMTSGQIRPPWQVDCDAWLDVFRTYQDAVVHI